MSATKHMTSLLCLIITFLHADVVVIHLYFLLSVVVRQHMIGINNAVGEKNRKIRRLRQQLITAKRELRYSVLR